MSNWTGEKLRRFLKANDISPEKLAADLKKTRGTIYNWIKQPTLDATQIAALKGNGIDLDAGATPTTPSDPQSHLMNIIEAYKTQVE